MWFASKIEEWYLENRRDLPWRRTTEAYKIWLSEIILQQTRIEQGLEYYLRFVDRYPTIVDLAKASEDEVLKCWQGLGYYSRARNLHSAAKYVADELGGEFPQTYEGILALKGVGRYTAAAVASFAYRLPYPVIDGNVYRLISRVFGVYTPIATTVAYKEFESLLLKKIDKERPDLFNQAMMDFGSTFCKPTGCKCEECIFKEECVAHKEGKVDLLPVKPNKVQIKNRYFYYLDVEWKEGVESYTLVHQRKGKDIWQGLYEMPLIESDVEIDSDITKKIKNIYGEDCVIENQGLIVHKLTHRTIVATFFKVKLHKKPCNNIENEQVISMNEIKKLPVSRLIDKYLNKK